MLTLSERAAAGGLERRHGFMTNPADAAIVDAIGPIRQIVQGQPWMLPRRYLVIASGSMTRLGQASAGAGTVISQMPKGSYT